MTKTFRKRGGRLLGEGAHGTVYNVGGDSDAPSFYTLLMSKSVQSIRIYSSDGFFKNYTKPQHIILFQDYINESTGKIAKVLKPTKNIENKFENELAENRRVIDIFDAQAEKYLTISALPPFLGKDVIGCIIYLYVGDPIYVCFSTKCENKFIPDLDKLIVDILESIEILQITSYRHNDIKLDNIVKCGDKYKLIDWEQIGKINDLEKRGTLIATSPIRWYLEGYQPYISKQIMSVKTTMRNFGFSRSTMYKTVAEKISSEFDSVIAENSDKSDLAIKYAYSFDIFMLGMTILHAVYKYKLNYEKYRSIILKFTSLKEPVRNAIDALNFVTDSRSI
jgi:hypothetical protein